MRNRPKVEPMVWIARSAAEGLWDGAEAHYPCETGGLLLGYRVSPVEAVITRLVGPGPLADHREDGFAPDTDYQEQKLARIYKETEGKATYLGDWHTHPGAAPRPSPKDRRTIERIARSTEALCEMPLMVLVGESEGDWQALAWQGRLTARGRLIVEVAGLRPFEDERSS